MTHVHNPNLSFRLFIFSFYGVYLYNFCLPCAWCDEWCDTLNADVTLLRIQGGRVEQAVTHAAPWREKTLVSCGKIFHLRVDYGEKLWFRDERCLVEAIRRSIVWHGEVNEACCWLVMWVVGCGKWFYFWLGGPIRGVTYGASLIRNKLKDAKQVLVIT